MALEKQTVSLNLANSLDQKDNEFTGAANTYEVLQDWTWDKDGRLVKRFGTETFPTDVVTDFPNPLSIGANDIKSAIIEHEGQLLIQNKGAFYSWDTEINKWIFKGHHYPVEAKTEVKIAREIDFTQPDFVKWQGYDIYAYAGKDTRFNELESVGGDERCTIRFTVVDSSTGNERASDIVLDSGEINISSTVGPSGYLINPKILAFQNKLFITWVKNVTSGVGAIRIAEINPTDWTFTILADLKTFGTFYCEQIDWVVTNKTGVGERAFCGYQTSTGATLFSVLNTGALDVTLGSVAISSKPLRGALSLHYSSDENIYAGFYIQNTSGSFSRDLNMQLWVRSYGFTTSAYTVLGASTDTFVNPAVLFNTIDGADAFPYYQSIAMIDDIQNPGQVIAFASNRAPNGYDTANSSFYTYQDRIDYRRLSAGLGAIGNLERFADGICLLAKPVADTNRNTIYIPAQRVSRLQSTNMILDFYKGKIEADGKPYAFVLAKTAYRDHLDNYAQMLPQAYVYDDVIYYPSQYGTGVIRIDEQRIIKRKAVALTECKLYPSNTLSNDYLSGASYFSGGYLGMYDGEEISEHNFHIQAEEIQAFSRASGDFFTFTGPTSTTFTAIMPNGAALLGSTSARFSFPTTTPVNPGLIYVRFRVNGQISGGPALGPDDYAVIVDVNGTETVAQIAYKVAQGINSLNFTTAWAQVTVNDQVQIQRNSIVAPTSTGTGTGGGPGVGTRSYCVVWSWADNNGFLHRGAPSNVVSITTSDNPICVVARCPQLTNRECKSVIAELYGTTNAGTTFYKIPVSDIATQYAQAAFKKGNLNVSFQVDLNFADSIIVSNEILYTDGGILANNSIGACKAVSVFKNRVVVAGLVKNYVNYSKTAQNNSPISFAEPLFLATDNDGQEVTVAKALDDKLVVFREKGIVAYAGDGANDLGTGISFSQPITVASDVGNIIPNAVELTPTGLWFRSSMGIGMISRGLEVSYPGEAVKDFNSFTISRAQILREDKKVREIRFFLQDSPNCIVYNYLKGKWTVFTQSGGDDACLWQGAMMRIGNDGVVYQEMQNTFKDVGSAVETYNPLLETAWLKVKNMQDFQRVYRAIILGALKSPHNLTYKIYYDYDLTNFDSYTFASSNISGVAPGDTVYQPEIHLKRQKCQSIKLVIQPVPVAPEGSEECLSLTDLTFQVGVKAGVNKVRKAKKI